MTNIIEYYRKKENTDTDSIVFEKVKEEDIKICGRTIEEVITILRGLDLERILDIKMTIENLEILFKTLKEKDEQAFTKWLENQFKGDNNE